MTARRYLTARERRELYEAQDGLCSCGRELGQKWIEDHIRPLALDGTNDIGNFRLVCHRCDKRDTAEDRRLIDKMNRLTGKTGGQWTGTHRGRGRLQSRGFGR